MNCMTDLYLAIADIAYLKAHNDETMTFSELRAELSSRGFTPGEGRGIASQIRATYNRAIKEGDKGVADCIASCYTDDNHAYSWLKD